MCTYVLWSRRRDRPLQRAYLPQVDCSGRAASPALCRPDIAHLDYCINSGRRNTAPAQVFGLASRDWLSIGGQCAVFHRSASVRPFVVDADSSGSCRHLTASPPPTKSCIQVSAFNYRQRAEQSVVFSRIAMIHAIFAMRYQDCVNFKVNRSNRSQ